MKWFRDNVYLGKEERERYIFLGGMLLACVMVKMYMLFLYSPPKTEIPEDVMSRIMWVEKDRKDHSIDGIRIVDGSDVEEATARQKPVRPNNPEKDIDRRSDISSPPAVFSFDPNMLSRDSLFKLGLSRHAVNSLLKYRSKGGTIRSVEQMKKINGLSDETYERIAPYVTLPPKESASDFQDSDTSVGRVDTVQGYASRYPQYKRKNPQPIEINTADTSHFMNFHGIGPVYASRIIRFRNSLGGFYNIDQVGDTWGLSDSVFQSMRPYLSVDTSKIIKRDINTADKEELDGHPYINWKKSKHILAYRKMHGAYRTMDDLYKLHGIKDDFVDTLKIYFEVR